MWWSISYLLRCPLGISMVTSNSTGSPRAGRAGGRRAPSVPYAPAAPTGGRGGARDRRAAPTWLPPRACSPPAAGSPSAPRWCSRWASAPRSAGRRRRPAAGPGRGRGPRRADADPACRPPAAAARLPPTPRCPTPPRCAGVLRAGPGRPRGSAAGSRPRWSTRDRRGAARPARRRDACCPPRPPRSRPRWPCSRPSTPALRLPTRVLAGAEPGEVVLVGSGDVTLAGPGRRAGRPAAAGTARRPRRDARAALEGAPVTRVLVDDTAYDGPRLGPGWKPTYVTGGDVMPVSAVSVDGGRTAPGRGAARAATPRSPPGRRSPARWARRGRRWRAGRLRPAPPSSPPCRARRSPGWSSGC